MKTVKKRVLGIEGGGTKTEWIYIEIDGGQQRVIEQGMLPAANFKLIPEGTLLSLFRTLPTDIAQVGAFLAGCGLDTQRLLHRGVVVDHEVEVHRIGAESAVRCPHGDEADVLLCFYDHSYNDHVSSLKPGGIYFIVDHAAAPGTGARLSPKLHRIDEATVIQEVTSAGFTLVDKSDILRNSDDDHAKTVFDPAIRMKTDQFILTFRKP